METFTRKPARTAGKQQKLSFNFFKDKLRVDYHAKSRMHPLILLILLPLVWRRYRCFSYPSTRTIFFHPAEHSLDYL